MRNVARSLCLVGIAGALVTGCGKSPATPSGGAGGTTSPPPTTNTAPAITDADLAFCVSETNRYRAMKGRPALTRSASLESFAAESARIDQQAGKAHQHYISTNGAGVSLAENEFTSAANASVTTQGTIQFGIGLFFSEGPGGGHYENMMSGYTQAGCGVFRTADVITIAEEFR